MVLTPDRQYVATGGIIPFVKLWSIETGALIRTFDNQNALINSLAFSPDCKTIAVGGIDYKIRLYDFETGTLQNTLVGHQNAIEALAFMPDNQTLLSASGDKSVKLWSLTTGRPLKTYVGHKEAVVNLVLSPDADFFLTGSEDGLVKMWHFTDAIEDNITEYPLFEMVDFNLQLEAADIPQYIEELVAFVAQTGADKQEMFEKVKAHFSDPAVLATVQKRLGLVGVS